MHLFRVTPRTRQLKEMNRRRRAVGRAGAAATALPVRGRRTWNRFKRKAAETIHRFSRKVRGALGGRKRKNSHPRQRMRRIIFPEKLLPLTAPFSGAEKKETEIMRGGGGERPPEYKYFQKGSGEKMGSKSSCGTYG